MKPLKTILLIIVLGSMGFFAIAWSVNGKIVGTGETYLKSSNEFEKRIKKKTDSIKNYPIEGFYTDYYRDINFELETFYEYGDLGKEEGENESVYNKLSIDLFDAYITSFTAYSQLVFNEMPIVEEELNHIKKEVKEIAANKRFLEVAQVKRRDFRLINEVAIHYDEVDQFISKCEKFQYSNYGEYAKYPIEKVKDMVQRIDELLTSDYIQKVKSFKENLTVLPLKLYQKHESYLKRKINRYGNDYNYYYAQHAYLNNIVEPLESQVNDLTLELYQLSDSVSSKSDLEIQLKDFAFKSVMFYLLKDNDNSVSLPMLFGDKSLSDYQESEIETNLKNFYYNVNNSNLNKVLNYFSLPLSRYYLSYDLDREELRTLYKKSFANYYHYNDIEWDNMRCYETIDGEIIATVMGYYSYKETVWDNKEKVLFMDKISLDSNYKIKSIYSIYKERL